MISHPERGVLPGLKISYLLRYIVAAAVVGTAIPVSAACVSHRLKLIDSEKLGEGAQIVDSFKTRHGALEERVIVTKGVASAPNFFLGDKPLSKTSKSELPEERDSIRKPRSCRRRQPGAGLRGRGQGSLV